MPHFVIYEDAAGRVHLSVDQPSNTFASFSDRRITEVAVQLDVKLAALLNLLGLPVPVELGRRETSDAAKPTC